MPIEKEGNVLLISTDKQGNIRYSQSIGGDNDGNTVVMSPISGLSKIAVDSDGNARVLINLENRTGTPASINGVVSNAITMADGSSMPSVSSGAFINYDPDGKELWTSLVARPDGADDARNVAQGLVVDEDGNSYIYNGESNWFATRDIVKIDKNGESVWQKHFTSEGSYQPFGGFIGLTENEEPILAANTSQAEDDNNVQLWVVNPETGNAAKTSLTAHTVADQWQEWILTGESSIQSVQQDLPSQNPMATVLLYSDLTVQ